MNVNISLFNNCETSIQFLKRAVYIGLMLPTFLILSLITAILYLKIIIVVKSKIYPSIPQSVTNGRENKMHKRQSKVTKVMTWVLGCYFLFYIPSVVVSPFIPKSAPDGLQALQNLVVVFWYMNSCTNPFIYGIKSKPFRKGFKKIFHIPLGYDDSATSVVPSDSRT